MLMKWGCDKADELGLPAFVQATHEGRLLYERFGFEDKDEEGWVDFPVSERFRGKREAGVFNLDRPVQGRGLRGMK